MTDDREKELEQQKAFTEKLFYFFKGDEWAVRFCVDFVYICHLWDDLIDKDKDRTDQEINDAFRIALVDIPTNPFFAKHRQALCPIVLNIILRWQDANVLERGNDHDKHMAYMHRAGMLEIFNICAYLIGGPNWVYEVGPDMRRMYEEKLEDFMEEMNHA